MASACESRPAQKLHRLMGQAIHRFQLINDGDRILIGASGGKDSLTLIAALANLRLRAPVKFKLGAAHLSFNQTMTQEDISLKTWLEGQGLDWLHWEALPEADKPSANEKNACYLCAKKRRARLFDLAGQWGAASLALGHHQDDAIETFLMNILYSGQTSTMMPRQNFFSGRLKLIRPLYLVPEELIVNLADQMRLPVLAARCLVCGQTKRQEIKDMIAALQINNSKVRGNIANAMFNVRPDYLPGSDLLKKQPHKKV